MVSKAKSLGMKAVALTDHGTFAGAVDFLGTCRKVGIKPILGMEAYMCRDHTGKSKKEQADGRKGNRHINLIAKNYQGFQNICALSQISSIEGYYYDPRIDFDLLNKHKDGVIVTSACLSNVINANLRVGNYQAAKKAASMFKEVFGGDFYLEMMYHGIAAEQKILSPIQRLSKELDIKTIVTNDCHYLTKEDARYHEILTCISTGKTVKDPKRLRFPYDEFYFKSAEEMAIPFGHCQQSMLNTIEIADKCDYSEIVLGGSMLLPKFDLPEGYSNPYKFLCDLAWKGMKDLHLDKSQVHIDRLTMELSDIKLIYDTKRFDFSTYFLIVWDIMRFAKEKGIASSIRGSGFGSLLLKCIGIVEGNIDPIKQELMWERFLGFDDAYFLSENDFGIKDVVLTN